MLVWIALVLLAVLIYFKVYKPLQYWKELDVPFVPPWPILGNMGPFVLRQKSMVDWVDDIYKSSDSRYVGMYQFNKPTLLLKDINLIKQVGIKDFDHFVDHRAFISEEIDPLFGKNLFSLRGQKWRHMRSTLSPAFTGSKMRSMYMLMSDCAEDFTKYFKEQIKPGQSQIMEMKDVFSRFANDVIASCAFGIPCDSMRDKDNEFYEMGKDATNFAGFRALKFFGYTLSPTLMKVFKLKLFSEDTCNFFRNLVMSNVRSREEQGIIRPDMIHLLMEARKGQLKHEEIKVKDEDAGFATVEESEVGKGNKLLKYDLTDDDVTAQALLFFIAGFDTISTAICHMCYELALNEDIQIKLQKEVDETFEKCDGKLTYDALLNMKYLDMVLSEALRKWPPGGAVDRVCNSSYTIAAENPGEHPIHLKKDDVVWFPVYPLHRDPKYFPNPDKFDPERFSDENKDQIQPLSYIPFGVGPRNCIGSRFALLEAKVVFAHMLSKFTFEICEKSQVPLKINKNQFNMNAEKGFWLALKARE